MSESARSAASALLPSRLRFDDFELDTAASELRREGAPVKLQQQPCKVLALLASRSGELVTRDEIRRSVWGEDTYVNFDQGLNFCIKEIRAALGDQADTPRFIETLPRRGYRFIAPVERSAASGPAEPPDGTLGGDVAPGLREVHPSRRGWRGLAAAILGLLLAVVIVQRLASSADPGAVPTDGRLMLAVLPFENLSADPQQDYLSEGLTEELIAQVGRLQPERLGVIARTSAMQYRTRDKDVEQIGRELGVHFVVEGSVRGGGDRVRITVKLIQVTDQTQLWAETYDRELGDLLAVQREVAEAVARSVQLTLTPGAQDQLRRATDVKPEAYELFLRGRQAWNRRDEAGLRRSVEFFEEAIARDPGFALAHVGLAEAWIELGDSGYAPPQQVRESARLAAERAAELDPGLAEAQASLATIRGLFDWEWQASLEGFERALELNPNSASSHHGYARMLQVTGRPMLALAQTELALQLDPLSQRINTTLGSALYYSGRLQQAAAQYRRTIQLDQEWSPAYRGLGRTLIALGQQEEGLRMLARGAELSPDQATAVATLAWGYAAVGESDRARELAAQLEEEDATSPYDLAVAWAAAGEPDRAFEHLGRALEARQPRLRLIRIDDRLAALREDPRFDEVVYRVGLAG